MDENWGALGKKKVFAIYTSSSQSSYQVWLVGVCNKLKDQGSKSIVIYTTKCLSQMHLQLISQPWFQSNMVSVV